ncbi:MAG: hypothetical protein ABSA26_18655 [Thermoguttaceae bacterium]
MNRKHVSYFLALATVVCFGVFSGSALCQPAERSAQQAIEKALSQKDAFKFTDVPLGDFVSVLREKYGMNVVIDQRALKEKELEAIVISTPGAIQGMLFTKVYDITDLASSDGEQGKTWEDLGSLVELFTSTVAPESWDAAGGRGTIQLITAGTAKMLVVSQDYRVQRQVEGLLSELNAAVKQHAPTKGSRGEGPGPGARGEGPGPGARGEGPRLRAIEPDRP